MQVHVQKLVNGFPILNDAFITKDYKTLHNLFRYSGISSMQGDFCVSYLGAKSYGSTKIAEYYIPELENSKYMFVRIRYIGDNKFSIETVVRDRPSHRIVVQEDVMAIDLEKLENWSKVLRATNRLQGTGRLYCKVEDDKEYFCCLGILGASCDEVLFSKFQNSTTLRGELLRKSLRMETTTASEHFQSIFIYLNDMFKFTFSQIANVIEQFVEAFKTQNYEKISVFRFRENEIIKY